MEQDTNRVINDTATAFRRLNSLCTRAERVSKHNRMQLMKTIEFIVQDNLS